MPPKAITFFFVFVASRLNFIGFKNLLFLSILNNGDKKINFATNICIDNLGFRYSLDGVEVLNSLDLIIEKGSIVGFIGATGSGKSTLLDILMGLLEPQEV